MFGVGVGIRVGGFTPSSGGGGLNPDAQAFITATGITDATEISAINTLVNDLQGYGLWTKMKAIYPMVGGTSTTCKYNLKDPRDLDAAFRLVFNGGWTFASTGATPNGTNGYADTKLNASVNLTTSSNNITIYSRTDNSRASCDYGAYVNGLSGVYLNIRWTDNKLYAVSAKESSLSFITVSNTNSNGFYQINRQSNTLFKVFKNSSVLATNTTTNTGTMPNLNICLSTVNVSGTFSDYSNRETAFASIGDGFTDTEASNLYSAVQQFNTTLSRQV